MIRHALLMYPNRYTKCSICYKGGMGRHITFSILGKKEGIMRYSIHFNLKAIQKHFFWVFSLGFLAACGIFSSPLPTVPTMTPVDVAAIYTQAAATGIAQLTATAANITPSPTATHVPEKKLKPSLSPTPTPLPKFPLDGYVMLFVKNGDLYFQDGNNSPAKLTHVGEKSYYPRLSDDHQKVVFSRGDGTEYSINTDGSQEQIIMASDWLATFKPGTNESILDFIPGTHQLLFRTYLCESQKYRSPCFLSLFLVDADIGKIKKLADLGLALQQNSDNKNIEVSPNGKMVAVGTTNGMSIFTLDGKMIRKDILPYKPSTSTVLFPSLFWLPDSSGLIVALPDTIYGGTAYSQTPANTLWRYMVESNVTTKIHLDNPPTPGALSYDISPNRNWIVYGGIGEAESSLFLGNLANGHTQIFGNDIQPYFFWSPDSEHFIYRSTNSILGAINKSSILIEGCDFEIWVDAKHFTCTTYQKNIPRTRMAEIDEEEIKIYDLGFDVDIEKTLLIKPKSNYSSP